MLNNDLDTILFRQLSKITDKESLANFLSVYHSECPQEIAFNVLNFVSSTEKVFLDNLILAKEKITSTYYSELIDKYVDKNRQ